MTTTAIDTPERVKSTRAPQLLTLSGFRYVAAMLILFSHYRTPEAWGDNAERILGRGYSAVTAFFILSGVVLTWSHLHKNTEKVSSLHNYFVDRFSRIYPLHWVVLLGIIALTGYDAENTKTFVSHILLLQAWNPDHSQVITLNSVAWFLSAQVFLYACFPFFIPLVMKLYKKLSGWAILIVGLIGVSIPLTGFIVAVNNGLHELHPENEQSAHYFLYRLPLTRLGDFLIGVAIALAIFHVKKFPYTLAIVLQIACVGAYIWAARREFNLNTIEGALSFDLTWIPIFTVLIFSLGVCALQPHWHPLSTKFMVAMGTLSFALYLVHLEPWSWYNDEGARVLFEKTSLHVGFLIGAIATAMIAAKFLNHYIEEPSEKFLRRKLRRTPKE